MASHLGPAFSAPSVRDDMTSDLLFAAFGVRDSPMAHAIDDGAAVDRMQPLHRAELLFEQPPARARVRPAAWLAWDGAHLESSPFVLSI